MEKDVGDTWALKLESCFSNFLEPQWGQAGLREPVTNCSEISPHDLQMYSKSGMGMRHYFTAFSASINTLAWRIPTKSATFWPSLKMMR